MSVWCPAVSAEQRDDHGENTWHEEKPHPELRDEAEKRYREKTEKSWRDRDKERFEESRRWKDQGKARRKGRTEAMQREKGALKELLGRALKGTRMPEEQVDAVWNILYRNLEPELDKLRDAMRTRNPEEVHERIERLIDHARELAELQREAPERFDDYLHYFKLERRARQLADDLSDMEPAGREAQKQRQELHKLLSKAFDVKQKQLRAEIEYMREEVRELQELVDKRERHKGEIIKRHIDDLTGAGEYLEW